MFGAGLNATELAELIERDLQLHVAFPCFPLDSSLGHTACSVVSSYRRFIHCRREDTRQTHLLSNMQSDRANKRH
jgi:hypothetical protein